MQFDKNGDGKLSKDELPERLQGLFEKGDLDKDGFLSKEEIIKIVLQDERTKRWLGDSAPSNIIVVPNRIINIVVKN